MRALVGSLMIICAGAMVACSGSSNGTAASATSTVRAALPGRGVELPGSQIPWDQVGPGWILATWSMAPDPPPQYHPTDQPLPESPVALYLFDPAGGRYAITSISPAPPTEPGGFSGTPRLADWSGDGRHALFQYWYGVGRHTTMIKVDLATGAKQTFTVDGDYAAGTYSRPASQAILVSTSNSLERVDLSGAKQLTFPIDQLGSAGKFNGFSLQTPDGGQLVLGTDKGMVVVGNDGAVTRELPMPGPRSNCRPVRWWTSAVVLAACDTPATASIPFDSATQLWQVPLAGGAPTALTQVNGHDLGYWNAWQVPSGTFLQNVPGCGGDGLLFRLTTDMQTEQVIVPGVDKEKPVLVVGVTNDKLVLKTTPGCASRTMSLVIYDPAANTATALPSPPGNGGMKNAILYPTS